MSLVERMMPVSTAVGRVLLEPLAHVLLADAA
jgi:hypothetical protein